MFEILFLLGTATLVLNGVRPLGPILPLSDLFYVAALLVLVAEGLFKRRPRAEWMPLHPLWATAALVFAGGLLATTQSIDPAASIVVTLKSVFLFSVWLSMGIVLARKKPQQDRLIGAFLVGAVATAAIAIADSWTGLEWGPAIYSMSGAEFPGVDLHTLAVVYGRFGGTLGHPNIQSHYTLVAIPIVLDLCISDWRPRRPWRALGWLVILAALIWVNLLTGSVSGLVGIALSFVLVLGFRLAGRLSRWFAPLLLFTASALLVLYLALSQGGAGPVSGLLRQMSANRNIDRALSETGPGRVDLVGEALSLGSQQPLIGYGMDLLSADLPAGSNLAALNVHNAPLRSWLAGGLLVFMGILLAYIVALGLSLRALASHLWGRRARYLLGLSASIIVWTTIDMVQPSFYQRFTWLTVALLSGVLLQLAASRTEPSARSPDRAPAVRRPGPQPAGLPVASSFFRPGLTGGPPEPACRPGEETP